MEYAECKYEIPVRQSKNTLRTEIDQLRRQQQSNDRLLSALARPEHQKEILLRLQSGQRADVISEWLDGDVLSRAGSTPSLGRDTAEASLPSLTSLPGVNLGSANAMVVDTGTADMRKPQRQGSVTGIEQGSTGHFSSRSQSEGSRSRPDLPSWAGSGIQEHPQPRAGSWADDIKRERSAGSSRSYPDVAQALGLLPSTERDRPAGSWTRVTEDDGLVLHLLALYFCWEYPTFASLSKDHFLTDFQNGRQRYCSPILVNALLALGCRFSTQPSTRGNPDDPHSSGDHFFQESVRLYHIDDTQYRLTTIQALGIMSLRETSCGRDSEGWYYAGQSVRLAMEMGLHHVPDEEEDDELAVRAATFWGAYALDQ